MPTLVYIHTWLACVSVCQGSKRRCPRKRALMGEKAQKMHHIRTWEKCLHIRGILLPASYLLVLHLSAQLCVWRYIYFPKSVLKCRSITWLNLGLRIDLYTTLHRLCPGSSIWRRWDLQSKISMCWYPEIGVVCSFPQTYFFPCIMFPLLPAGLHKCIWSPTK